MVESKVEPKVDPKVENAEALITLRKWYAMRTKEYEGKIKYLVKQIDEEKKKPAFKTSRDERHSKYQEAARRTLAQMDSKLTYFKNMREEFLAELNACNAELKGHVLLPAADGAPARMPERTPTDRKPERKSSWRPVRRPTKK